ncbi:hypothetical protein HYY70_01940 [Candidatus Woesearchaeota archaeon]|nr:hypothetical protein [Candidatus Woesearchaeota archaeon]
MLKLNKSKVFLYSVLFVVMTFIALNIHGFYKKEFLDNPLIKESIISPNANYFYSFYLTGTPSIQNVGYYGSPNASITIIAFLDIGSDASKYFVNTVLPQLDEEFIMAGKVKFYPKHYLTSQDIIEKNDKFLYAANLLCVESLKKDVYYRFYFDLLNLTGLEEFKSIMEKFNITKENLSRCLQELSLDRLKIDVSEVENFDILGINPRFYIGMHGRDNTIIDGVPSYTKLRRTIRQYEVLLGD